MSSAQDCKKESEVEIPIAKRKPILYAILKEYKTDKRYANKSNNPYEMSTYDMILDKDLKLRIQDEERQLFVAKNIEKFLEAAKKDELIKNERQLTRLELEENLLGNQKDCVNGYNMNRKSMKGN